MKEIQLTQGQVAKVDDEDYEELNKYKWHAAYSPSGRAYYASRTVYVDGKPYMLKMHRHIMGCVKGDGKIIDHNNHDTLDNRRCNLRLANQKQNRHNSIANIDSLSKYKGVYYHKANKKWAAQITAEGIRIFLGLYYSEEEAARAYNEKAKELHGEFSYLNEVNNGHFQRIKPNPTSKYKGVYWNSNRNKWHVQIYIDKKNKYLGTFSDEEEANQAYLNALNKE